MLKGKKTYLVAAGMIAYGVLGYVLDYLDGMEAGKIVFEGLGLAGLRAGVSKGPNTALLPVVLLALFLAGCSTGPQSFGELRDRFQLLNPDDISAALADAKAHNDAIAEACFTALQKYAEPKGGENRPEIKGVLSLYQRARNLNQGADKGIPADIKLGCSGLVVDGEKFLLKMGLLAVPGGGATSWLGNLWPF